MANSFPILIMMAPHGPSPVEEWVSLGIRSAALDLILRLGELQIKNEIYVLAADPTDRAIVLQHGAIPFSVSGDDFHFSQALVRFIHELDVDRMAYFGAGSAPLCGLDVFEKAIDQVISTDHRTAVVNSLHSTDWAIFNNADRIQDIASRLPSDNQIGWVLKNDVGYEVHDLPVSAATRADIDTPTDLLMMKDHPKLGMNLRDYLSKQEVVNVERVTDLLRIITTPASHLTIIGRASSRVWQEVERRTQIWTRLFVEERGMVASGRMASGEVKSIIAELIQKWGPKDFIHYLGSISDAVLWDTRVWMAHQGGWPSKADRFAADLGLVEEIQDVPLKKLTAEVFDAPIPIVTGGHGVVAGGLFALLESIE